MVLFVNKVGNAFFNGAIDEKGLENPYCIFHTFVTNEFRGCIKGKSKKVLESEVFATLT